MGRLKRDALIEVQLGEGGRLDAQAKKQVEKKRAACCRLEHVFNKG